MINKITYHFNHMTFLMNHVALFKLVNCFISCHVIAERKFFQISRKKNFILILFGGIRRGKSRNRMWNTFVWVLVIYLFSIINRASGLIMQVNGSSWAVPTGRRDGRVSLVSDADNLPAFTDSIDVQKQKFSALGLNTQDLVALVGNLT